MTAERIGRNAFEATCELAESESWCWDRACTTHGHLYDSLVSSDSHIDPSTIQAFLETEYCVHGDATAVLQVGVGCAELADLHQAHAVDCSAFVTACNPFSQVLGDAANAARQEALAHELKHRSLRFIDGVGQHLSNQWPGEASFLVLGLTLEAAKRLGDQFEQNAIIWNGADAVPRLILLR